MTDTSAPNLAQAAAEALQAVAASTGPDTDVDVPAAFGVIAGLVELVGHLGEILAHIDTALARRAAHGAVELRTPSSPEWLSPGAVIDLARLTISDAAGAATALHGLLDDAGVTIVHITDGP